MKTNLVRCPNCEINGRKEVLGEVSADGQFIVMRFHRGETVINSDSFSVICGRCGGTAFFREGSNERKGIDNGFIWFSRLQFGGTLGTIGA